MPRCLLSINAKRGAQRLFQPLPVIQLWLSLEMKATPKALLIPELVEQCIDFRRESTSDSKACALVCRSWMSAAQANLFRQVSLNYPEHRWDRLQPILQKSPHLISHIRRLSIDAFMLPVETFSKICNFPFTHVNYVHLYHPSVGIPEGLSIGRLFSLSNLKHIHLYSQILDPSVFPRIWEHCSHRLRHLDLTSTGSRQTLLRSLDSISHTHPPIVLDSLRIQFGELGEEWLKHDRCRLDISHLKALSIKENVQILQWPQLAPALQTIVVLDVVAAVCVLLFLYMLWLTSIYSPSLTP
jgi:hypothetical protein